MIRVSEIYTNRPDEFRSDLHRKVYDVLDELNIQYERVDNDETLTMEDCIVIDKKLGIEIIKTLFLCNASKTEFYLYIVKANKRFNTKAFSKGLNISRVSFASEELFNEKLGTAIGAASILCLLNDPDNKIHVIIDKNVYDEEYFGCSDTTKYGYMKVLTKDIVDKFLEYTKHKLIILEDNNE